MTQAPPMHRSEEIMQTLLHARGPFHLSNAAPDPARPDLRFEAAVSPPAAAAVRIRAEVSARRLLGVPGGNAMILTHLHYADSPLFWDTIMNPPGGSYPWRTLDCAIHARLPITKVEVIVRFHGQGDLSLRNVRVDAIPQWDDDPDAVVAVIGDSTDMAAYLPREWAVACQLENLLRDRFHDRYVHVRNFAEGGDYLQRVLSSGRLERELKALPRCDVAVIRYGLNDRGQQVTPAAFGEQLQQAGRLVQAIHPAAAVCVATTIPDFGDIYIPAAREIAAANGWQLLDLASHIRRLSASGLWNWHNGPGRHVGYVTTGNPPDNPTGLEGDKHPNALGCRLIAEFLYHHVEPLLAAAMKTAPGA